MTQSFRRSYGQKKTTNNRKTHMKYQIDADTLEVRTELVPCTNSGYHWPRLAQEIARSDSDPVIEGHRIQFQNRDGAIEARFAGDEPVEHNSLCQFIEKVQKWFSNRMSHLEALKGDLDLLTAVKEAQNQDDN